MGVSINRGTPKSSILIGFSIINPPFWGTTNLWKPPYHDVAWIKPEKMQSLPVMNIPMEDLSKRNGDA